MGIGKNNMMRGGGGLAPGQTAEQYFAREAEQNAAEQQLASLVFWCMVIGLAVAVGGGLILQYTVG
jgi:hypothetical protein